MKNLKSSIAILFITLALVSCKSKMSEKMKEEFSQVKNDWGLFASDLASFGDTLKVNKDKLIAADKKILKKINKANQDKMETFKTNSANYETTMTNTWNDFNAFQKSFTDSTTAFNTWASKIDTLKTSDKEVRIPIENYKTFLNNAKAKWQQWSADMTNTMDASKKDIEDAIKIVGTAPAKATKGTGGKKKKK